MLNIFNDHCMKYLLLEEVMVRKGFPVAQIKNLPEMLETCVVSLGEEHPMEKTMATHSSILAWRIPTHTGAWRATVHRVQSRTQQSN